MKLKPFLIPQFSLFLCVSFSPIAICLPSNPCSDMPTITDPRDGQVYPAVQIDTQCWLQKKHELPDWK